MTQYKAEIPFFIAKAEDYSGKYFQDLDLPPFFNNDGDEVGRSPAFCSSKWKRDVFTRFCNEKFGVKNYDITMGFSTDEIHRAGRMKSTKKWTYKFPLLDLRMNRGDCINLVEKTFNTPPQDQVVITAQTIQERSGVALWSQTIESF